MVAVGATAASLLAAELFVRLVVDVSVVPFLRDYDPDLGLRYKKNLTATISYPEFSMQWSTNSRGFRGPEPPASPQGCIVILGDSFSEGWGVNDGEEYASLLRQALDARYGEGVVPVINAAVSASGNGRWIKLLQGDLADYQPRLVLLQACWNDAIDNVREKMFRLVRVRPFPDSLGTTTELVELVGQPKPLRHVIQPLLETIPGLQESHLFALIRSMGRDDSGGLEWHLEVEAPFEKYRQEIEEINGRPFVYDGDFLVSALVEHSLAICRRRGWPTALMSVRIGGTPFEELQRICERFDTPLLDFRDRAQNPDHYYEIDGHWNAAGHRFVADQVLERLLAPDSEYLRGLRPLKDK